MLYGLISLTLFDAVAVALTFLTVILVQFLNATTTTKTTTTTNTEATTNVEITTNTATTIETTAKTKTTPKSTNGKILKQKSLPNSEDLSTPFSSSSSSSSCPTPPATARNSISSPYSGSISPPSPPTPLPPSLHPSGTDSLSDEYHEDEDTLSLENLFPCDQSEIYASKKISFIIDELIQTEANYVRNLRKGLANYGCLQERQDLPEALQGAERQQQLLGNIEEILQLHEQQIQPLMLRNQYDLKQLFDDFAAHFDKNNFYCYVIFTMNKKTSMLLRQDQRDWLQNYQTEINDKLGIDSFLVQPIQRLTRYPLLLQQFISEFYKSGISCKPVLMSVCKLETRMRRLLEVVNQAEEVLNIDEVVELNLQQQGYFRRSTEFDAYHHRSRKKYRAKVFLFDRCLVCTEVRKKRLAYRQHYAWETLELQLNSSKSVTLLLRPSNGGGATNAAKEELELSTPEAISVTHWMRVARKIIEREHAEAVLRGKFSLPMDLVLGVAFAVWLIWHYLY